jgi:hypothetical protein
MARKEPDPPHELDPLKGGLKHNPFAALRGKVGAGSASEPAAAPPSAQAASTSSSLGNEPVPES